MTGPDTAPKRKQYEFQNVNVGKTISAEVLAPYGKEGWFIATVIERPGVAFWVLFQREIVE